jgi:hypothetical protein
VPRITTCQTCATTFPSRSSRARYCSDTCRSRARYARTIGHPIAAPMSDPLEVSPGAVADAIRHDLEVLGHAHTTLGLAALALAYRIDAGAESSTGLAALTRELRSCLAEARAQGDQSGDDALIEIKAKRAQRRAAAADFPVIG